MVVPSAVVVILPIITLLSGITHSFQVNLPHRALRSHLGQILPQPRLPTPLYGNIYDEWRSDMTVDTLPLDAEFVQMCLDEMIYSDYGEQMFGVHDRTGTCR